MKTSPNRERENERKRVIEREGEKKRERERERKKRGRERERQISMATTIFMAFNYMLGQEDGSRRRMIPKMMMKMVIKLHFFEVTR